MVCGCPQKKPMLEAQSKVLLMPQTRVLLQSTLENRRQLVMLALMQ